MENKQELEFDPSAVPQRPKDFKADPRPTCDILFGIDEILDTRMGTLASIDNELASKALNSGKYFTRTVDEFPGISEQKFNEAYANRNADILPLSIVTNLSFFLQRIVKDALVADNAGDAGQNELVFNFNLWPYELEQEEIDMMIACITNITLGYGRVKVVNLSPKDLTPSYIKANFDIVVCYDFQVLLAEHDGEFVKTPCPGVSLICPALYRGVRPNRDDIEYSIRMGKSLFEMTRLALVKMIGLKFQPVSLFCITERITPENKDIVASAVSLTEQEILAAKKKLGDKLTIENEPQAEIDKAKSELAPQEPDNAQSQSDIDDDEPVTTRVKDISDEELV